MIPRRWHTPLATTAVTPRRGQARYGPTARHLGRRHRRRPGGRVPGRHAIRSRSAAELAVGDARRRGPAADRRRGPGRSGAGLGVAHAAGHHRRVVREHDLCARQRLCGQVVSSISATGSRRDRCWPTIETPETRRRAGQRPGETQVGRGRGRRAYRPRPSSPRPLTSAGAIRPRASCRSRSANPRRPTTIAPAAQLNAARPTSTPTRARSSG